MPLLTTWDYQGDYTKQFGAKWAGTFGDMFCRAVRNGAETPREVLEAVERKTQMALQDSENGSERFESYRKLQNSLKTSDACDFAEFILERESLSPEEKAKLKETRAFAGLNVHADAQPPTDKQLGYLKNLGCKITPVSKLEASNLISEALKVKQPSAEVF